MDIRKEFLMRVLLSQFIIADNHETKEVEQIVNYLYYVNEILEERECLPPSNLDPDILKSNIMNMLSEVFDTYYDKSNILCIRGEYYDDGLSMNDTLEKIKLSIRIDFLDEIIDNL